MASTHIIVLLLSVILVVEAADTAAKPATSAGSPKTKQKPAPPATNPNANPNPAGGAQPNTKQETDDSLTREAAKVLLEIVQADFGSLGSKCEKAKDNFFNKYTNTNAEVFGLCQKIETVKSSDLSACNAKEVKQIRSPVCDIIKEANEDKDARIAAIMKAATSKKCQTKVNIKKASGWKDLENLCDGMDKKATKPDYEKACPKGEYEAVYKAGKCNGASSLLSGALTLTLSMLAAFVFKSQ